MELSWDLYETPGDELEAFVRHILLPQRDWKEEVQDAWQRICKFLQHQCFEDELVLDQEVRVLKVVKGGSSGKGTTLNQSSDLDVILFLSCFSSFQSQQLLRDGIISFMEDKLERCGRSLAYQVKVASHKGPRPARSLSLQLQSKKSSRVIRMDLLPAFDVLGSLCPDSKPAPDIYEDLINSSSYPGEFSPSFTVIQRHFVKSRPIKLKNLLQLVKFWYLKYLKEKHRKVTLPSKYALELLTIYAWEMGTEESESFDLDTGLVAVMELLRDYKNICIYWTKYYDFQNQTVRNCIKQQLKECRPVILDPADPTNNLGRKRNWDVVAKEATYCLRQACCQTVDHSQRWHVPRARDVQVTVKQTGQETWSISVPPYNPIWRIKAEIKKRNLVFGEQRLSFQEPGGEPKLLSSHRSLGDYGIFSKVTIWVLDTFPPQIQVFVKDASGQSTPYAIYPDDTILCLKGEIEGAGGPRVEDQVLKFQGRKLRDHHNFTSLEIKDSDTITLERKDLRAQPYNLF